MTPEEIFNYRMEIYWIQRIDGLDREPVYWVKEVCCTPFPDLMRQVAELCAFQCLICDQLGA